MNNDIVTIIGTAFIDEFGGYCQELVDAGYDLEDYYNAGTGWGDFSKVLIKAALLRGAESYDDYERFFNQVKPNEHKLASKQLFARVSGFYTPRKNTTQTDRTRAYRRRNAEELRELRRSTALAWIDNNLDEAKTYINKKNNRVSQWKVNKNY